MAERGTSPCNGSVNAEEHPAIQTRRVGLFAKYHLLWDRWNSIRRIWYFPTQMAGTAGSRLLDDWVGIALGRRGKLFGKQEI